MPRDEYSLAHTVWNCKYHIVFAPKYERTIKLCNVKNIKYEYEDNGHEFSFSFIRSNDTKDDTINDTKGNREQDIINIIKRNKHSTRESIAAELGIST